MWDSAAGLGSGDDDDELRDSSLFFESSSDGERDVDDGEIQDDDYDDLHAPAAMRFGGAPAVFSLDELEDLEEQVSVTAAADGPPAASMTDEQIRGMLVGLLGSASTSASAGPSALTGLRVKAKALALTPLIAARASRRAENQGFGDLKPRVRVLPVIDAALSRVAGHTAGAAAAECAGEEESLEAYLGRLQDLHKSREPEREVAERLAQATIPFVTSASTAVVAASTCDCVLACALPRVHVRRVLGGGDPVHVVGALVMPWGMTQSSGDREEGAVFDHRAYRSHLASLKAGDPVTLHYYRYQAVGEKEDEMAFELWCSPAEGVAARVVRVWDGAAVRVSSAAAKEVEVEVRGDASSEGGATAFGRDWAGPQLSKRDLVAGSRAVAIVVSTSSGDGATTQLAQAEAEQRVRDFVSFLAPTALEGLELALGAGAAPDAYLRSLGLRAADVLSDAALSARVQLALRSRGAQDAQDAAARVPAAPSAPGYDDTAGYDYSRDLVLADIPGYDRVLQGFLPVSDAPLVRALHLAANTYAADAHVMRLIGPRLDRLAKACAAMSLPGLPDLPDLQDTQSQQDKLQTTLKRGKKKVKNQAGGDDGAQDCTASVQDAVMSSLAAASTAIDALASAAADCPRVSLAQGHVRSLLATWSRLATRWALANETSVVDESAFEAHAARRAAELAQQRQDALAAAAALAGRLDTVLELLERDRDAALRYSQLPRAHWLEACAASLPEKQADRPFGGNQAGIAVTEQAMQALLDVDFESAAHYSRMPSPSQAGAPARIADILADEAAAAARAAQSQLGTEDVVMRFCEACFADAPSESFYDAVIKNVSYYNPDDDLQSQIQRQVQVVRLKRAEIRARVKLSGPRFEAFEKDLIDNMRRRTASLHHVKTLVYAAALVLLMMEKQPAALPAMAQSGSAARKGSSTTTLTIVAGVAASVADAILLLSDEDRPDAARMSKQIAHALEVLQRDKPNGVALVAARAEPAAAWERAAEPGGTQAITEEDEEKQQQVWSTFRPRLAHAPAGGGASKAQQVLARIAEVVDAEKPLLVGVNKQPVRLNACCLQALSSSYNVHDTLGVGEARRGSLAAQQLPLAAAAGATTSLAAIAYGSGFTTTPTTPASPTTPTSPTTPASPTTTIAAPELVIDGADGIEAIEEVAADKGAPQAMRDGPQAAQRLVEARARWKDDALVVGLAGASTEGAVNQATAAMAVALQTAFDRLTASFAPEFAAAAGAQEEGRTPQENADDGLGAARRLVVDGAKLPPAEFGALAAASAAYAGSSLRTLVGKLACAFRAPSSAADDDDGGAKNKSGKADASRPRIGDAWRARLDEAQGLVASSGAGAQAFREELRARLAGSLPEQAVFDVDASAHGGMGHYVSALLALYASFAFLEGALLELGPKSKIPTAALRPVFLASVGLLVDVHGFIAHDANLKRVTDEQKELSKRRKIDIYEKSLESLEDRDLLREVRRIKDLDWGSMEDEFGDRPPPALPAASSTSGQEAEEDENYFMTAPGRDEDGYEDREHEYGQ